MKTSILAIALLGQSLSATVIVNDATLTPISSFFGDYELKLTQSIPSGQGLFRITFDFDLFTETLDFTGPPNTYSIAEEFRLYLPTAGTQLDPQYVASTTPVFTNSAPSNWSVPIPFGTSVLIGYWDDRFPLNTPPAANDNYGWVRITNTASGLVASSGATAIGGGIIVGTNTQVPEPGTAALLLLGIASLSMRRTRQGRH